jgi:hypothetical protein
MIWYSFGITVVIQEEKKKERRKRSNFVFFSDEKNKIGNLHATEWVEIISNSNLFHPISSWVSRHQYSEKSIKAFSLLSYACAASMMAYFQEFPYYPVDACLAFLL